MIRPLIKWAGAITPPTPLQVCPSTVEFLKDIALSHKTLEGLEDIRYFVIIKPGKGNGGVILNYIDYNKKMDAILSNYTKFFNFYSSGL